MSPGGAGGTPASSGTFDRDASISNARGPGA